MLELEELSGPVGGLTKGNDPRLSNHRGERLHIRESMAGLDGTERDGVRANPIDDFLRCGTRG